MIRLRNLRDGTMRGARSARRWSATGLLLVGLAGGCATNSGGAGSTGGRGSDVEVHLFTVPVAMNLEGNGGADGIGVRVYFSTPGGVRGIPLRKGTLEILMYNGMVSSGNMKETPPLKVWSFEASRLAGFEDQNALGIVYQLPLKWQKARPSARIISVVARYRSAQGVEQLSTVNSITIPAKSAR